MLHFDKENYEEQIINTPFGQMKVLVPKDKEKAQAEILKQIQGLHNGERPQVDFESLANLLNPLESIFKLFGDAKGGSFEEFAKAQAEAFAKAQEQVKPQAQQQHTAEPHVHNEECECKAEVHIHTDKCECKVEAHIHNEECECKAEGHIHTEEYKGKPIEELDNITDIDAHIELLKQKREALIQENRKDRLIDTLRVKQEASLLLLKELIDKVIEEKDAEIDKIHHENIQITIREYINISTELKNLEQ